MIKLKNVSFKYEETPVLENVDVMVEKGEFIGIFGPNGGGKTTFLKLILGFLKPTSGIIEVLGSSPKEARQQMGYVPQMANFDKQFPISVLEVVLMGCLSELSLWGTFSRKTKQKAREALSRVGLLEKESDAFGTLSGGQAQRTLIARALVNNPEILLLDEPTASIDSKAEEEVYRLLLQLKGTMTILMVTHDLQSVLQKADRLLCIQRRVTSFSPTQMCEHFALGLYHPPLLKK
jgi:zinc transport system ATP-binding protein